MGEGFILAFLGWLVWKYYRDGANQMTRPEHIAWMRQNFGCRDRLFFAGLVFLTMVYRLISAH